MEDLFEKWAIMAESEGDINAWVRIKYDNSINPELIQQLKSKLESIHVKIF